MEDQWEKLIREIEGEIWQDFSETVKEHVRNPKNVGQIKDADGYAYLQGQCGDSIQIWVKVKEGIIEDIKFWTDGCGTTIASGSMITELARGKKLEEALSITPLILLKAMGGLPEDSEHCAILATNTLHEAIKDYQRKNH